MDDHPGNCDCASSLRALFVTRSVGSVAVIRAVRLICSNSIHSAFTAQVHCVDLTWRSRRLTRISRSVCAPPHPNVHPAASCRRPSGTPTCLYNHRSNRSILFRALELLEGLSPRLRSSTSAASFPRPEIPADELAEYDTLSLAKCYFDTSEYQRCAHALKDASSARAVFLRNYATLLAFERSQEDNLNVSTCTIIVGGMMMAHMRHRSRVVRHRARRR